MKLEDLLKRLPEREFYVGHEQSNHIETPSSLVAVCGGGFPDDDENQAAALLLAHCATQLPKLVNSLRENLPPRDLAPRGEDGERNNLYQCIWCGREYDFDETGIIEKFCPSDDCPGHQIRAALRNAETVEAP